MRRLALAAALALSGCASTYQMTLMPRDSGKTYTGIAEDDGKGEGRLSVTIEGKTYSGTWVQVVAATSYGFLSGGYGWGRYGGYGGMGGTFVIDNPHGGEAKALLTAPDGSGLRCDLRSGDGRGGGGVCRDDEGREYDVQMRLAEKK